MPKYIHERTKKVKELQLSEKQALMYGYHPYQELKELPDEKEKTELPEQKEEQQKAEDATESKAQESNDEVKTRGRKKTKIA